MAATSASSSVLFSDLFTTKDVDRDGKKFDRVSRITAKSANHDMDLSLDINTDLLPITPSTTFSFALASSLLPDGEKEGEGGWRAGIEGSMADEWEYVMYGKVYKFDEETAERVTAYASFGGLLMALSGSYRHVSGVTVGEYVYLLLRR
ncbi:RNA polymerase I [Leucosporidium creatinivorum]|uniref:DNA-directed RNA polymerases I, II, and III subunit RPABC3 n=1 Tax=Leucosporidium creatinivorum TaxID=106004 RepID=A0A1Y2FP47_9BASI|nr:RNA polymerase I [Leucosporidium creatinivorum]